MLAYRYPLIAREGWLWIAIVFCAAVAAQIFFAKVSVSLWILTLLLIYLFRDPHREVPALPLGIVCPVDGRVIAIEKVHDEYLDRTAICISVKMGITSVYSVHSPMEGKIMKQWLNEPRKIRPAVSENSHFSATNVSTYAHWLQSDEEDDVVMVMEGNSLIPNPHCYAHSGERIGQGQRCGFLRFGTQVDVLLPECARVEVSVRDRLYGGSNIVATLVRENEPSQHVTEPVTQE